MDGSSITNYFALVATSGFATRLSHLILGCYPDRVFRILGDVNSFIKSDYFSSVSFLLLVKWLTWLTSNSSLEIWQGRYNIYIHLQTLVSKDTIPERQDVTEAMLNTQTKGHRERWLKGMGYSISHWRGACTCLYHYVGCVVDQTSRPTYTNCNGSHEPTVKILAFPSRFG